VPQHQDLNILADVRTARGQHEQVKHTPQHQIDQPDSHAAHPAAPTREHAAQSLYPGSGHPHGRVTGVLSSFDLRKLLRPFATDAGLAAHLPSTIRCGVECPGRRHLIRRLGEVVCARPKRTACPPTGMRCLNGSRLVRGRRCQLPPSRSNRCRHEFGLRVALRQPCAERVDNDQTDDEEAYAREDLEAALLCLVGNLTRYIVGPHVQVAVLIEVLIAVEDLSWPCGARLVSR